MAEEKDVEERKPFITFSFTEEGNFDRYAGIYLHLPLEKPPTGEEIAIMVGTIKTYAETWHKIKERLEMVEAPPQSPEPPPDEPHEAAKAKVESSIGEVPRCPKRGVWAAAKGDYPEGYKRDWRHTEPRMNKRGELYCPTPIGKDEATDSLLWCPWRAKQGEGDEWEEYEVGAQPE